MKDQIETVKEIADSMIGIGGIPSNEEFYAEFDMHLREAFNVQYIDEEEDGTTLKDVAFIRGFISGLFTALGFFLVYFLLNK